METIKKFIAERGLALMMCGMMMVLAGAVSYTLMKQRAGIYFGTPWPTAAIAASVLGFVVYAVGRVSVAMQRKRKASARTPDE